MGTQFDKYTIYHPALEIAVTQLKTDLNGKFYW